MFFMKKYICIAILFSSGLALAQTNTKLASVTGTRPDPLKHDDALEMDYAGPWQVVGSWQKFKANAALVDASGRRADDLQKAIDIALTGIGTSGQDFMIKGADAPTGGAAVINNTRTVAFPATQGKRIDIGSVTIRGDASLGSAPGLWFDSQEMMDFSLSGGQVTYRANGIPVLFAPEHGTPLDGNVGIVDSQFKFTTTGPVAFRWLQGSPAFAEADHFYFGELNYSNAQNGAPENADFYVPTVASGQNFGYNLIQSPHVHGSIGIGTLWKIGNGPAPAGQDFGDNIYQLNLIPDSSPGATGIDTYESNSTYIANIGRITTGTPLKLEPGACGNIFILGEDSNWPGNVDASGCTTNLLLGNGRYGFGLNDFLSSPAPNELALTTNKVPAVVIGASQNVSFTTSYGYQNILSSAAGPVILSGFGANAAIISGNGTATFRIKVGDGSTADSGVLRLPAAGNGWNCQFSVFNPNAQNLLAQNVMTVSTATSVTVKNELTSTGAATSWPAGTVLIGMCAAY
jgi:hypothetical protein